MRAKLVLPAVLAVALLAGCGTARTGVNTADKTEPIIHTEVSYEAFSTVQSLSASSDVVVTGTVGDIVFRGEDTGGNIGPGAGVPMVYYEFKVDQVLSDGAVDPVVVVGRLDADVLGIVDQTTIRAGQDLVLFLNRAAPTRELGNALNATLIYTTLSGDNGVLDVSGDTVTARSPVLTGLNGAAGKDDTAPLDTTIADIQRVVTASR